jgi:hypothetical protein
MYLQNCNRKAYDNQSENISAELLHVLQDKTTEINQYDILLIKLINRSFSGEYGNRFREEGITQ